jgi:hypothetical protein
MINIRLSSLSIVFLIASLFPIALGLALVRKGYIGVHRRPYVRRGASALLCAGVVVIFICLIFDASAAALFLL